LEATPVTARRFGEELDENFISFSAAQKLGLNTEELDSGADGTDEMVLVVADGDRLVHRRVIGTVVVWWWAANRPGFRLMMWVMEGGLPDGTDIALGRPYEKGRNHCYKR
jgi:hypothetical protein